MINTMEFCRKYGLTLSEVNAVLKEKNVPMTPGKKGGMDVDDAYASIFDDIAQEQIIEEARKAEEEEAFIKATSHMLISSGFSFEGYKIVKYSGYISGDDCVTIPRNNFFGTNKVGDNLCDALVKIRRRAIAELKKAAYDMGCNAVVGVDFDYITIDPQHNALTNASVTVYEPYVICVTANGNAVVIEKNE